MSSNQQSSSRIQRSAPAFTLVELLLVMALLTIVVSVGIPMLSSFFRGRTLDNEARRLLAITRYAQAQAISDGTPVVVWFDQRRRVYGVEGDSGYDDDLRTNMIYTLDRDVEMEIITVKHAAVVPQNNFMGNKGRLSATPIVAQPNNAHRNYPNIRFLEDGTIAESSPEAIRLKGAEDNSMVVAQMRPRTSANNNRPNLALRAKGFEMITKGSDWNENDLYR
jgi:type II secretion system protein H